MIKHMYKLFFIVFVFITTFFTNSFSEVIKDIKIYGNERVNDETIKIFGGIKEGDDIDTKKLNDVLKKLYETNFFKDINFKINNSILEITVDENPIVQNLILEGIKNKDLIKAVENKITTKEKSPFIENKINNDIDKVKDLIQDIGYYFSSVDLLIKENENNTIDLIFKIDLGKKAFINEISFLGNKVFKKRKLLNVITSEEDRFWKFISRKRLVNKQRLELDQRLLLIFRC